MDILMIFGWYATLRTKDDFFHVFALQFKMKKKIYYEYEIWDWNWSLVGKIEF